MTWGVDCCIDFWRRHYPFPVQWELYQQASAKPEERFQGLCQHITRPGILEYAYLRVRQGKKRENGAGVDGVTFTAIETSTHSLRKHKALLAC